MNDIMSEKVRAALNNPATRDLVMEVYLRRRSRTTKPPGTMDVDTKQPTETDDNRSKPA